MKRRLFNILSALSLLLCVATVTIWVASRYCVGHAYVARWSQAGPESLQTVGMTSYDGRLKFVRNYVQISDGPEISQLRKYTHEGLNVGSEPNSLFLAFGLDPLNENNARWIIGPKASLTPLGSESTWRVLAPCWSIAVLAAILPAVWVRRKYRAACQCRSGHCVSCGYDLRATPERCPECGAAPAGAVK
jgi:hypothetical protein